MIEFNHVGFGYSGVPVLENISFAVRNGEFVCILGQSGCGKSTLLRLAAGLSDPMFGTVAIDGSAVHGPDRRCAVVFQDYSLFPWMTTGENLVLALKSVCPGKTRKELRETAGAYLEMVGLGGSFGKFPAALSGGMRQRAAIARALSVNSPVLLMDEPFGALDPVNRIMLQDMLLKLWHDSGSRRTLLFVTHDVDEALFLADRIIVLESSPGRVSADLAVPRRKEVSRTEFFAQPAIGRLQGELFSLYRKDALHKLEMNSLQKNGSGI
jgi:ABC-type nitrate/sulfonate/bicarbonate transport system ATPase subunit